MERLRVNIGICTLDRPGGLERALAGLDAQRLRRMRDEDISVTVVDNSAACSARDAAMRYAGQGRFAMSYVAEPRRGLSNARNAVLAHALPQADFLAFLDDDEAPAPGWIEALLLAAEAGGHAAVVGPVHPLFKGLPPRWALDAGLYAMVPALRDDGQAVDGYTGNCLLRCAVLRELDLAFDPSFNDTGGEDTHFFAALRKAGHGLSYAPEAVVHEFVDPARLQPAWLMRRWYRTGIIEAVLRRRRAGMRGRAGALGGGVLRLGGGGLKAIMAASGHLRGDKAAYLKAGYTLMRGAGLLAGAFGGTYREYAKSLYRKR